MTLRRSHTGGSGLTLQSHPAITPCRERGAGLAEREGPTDTLCRAREGAWLGHHTALDSMQQTVSAHWATPARSSLLAGIRRRPSLPLPPPVWATSPCHSPVGDNELSDSDDEEPVVPLCLAFLPLIFCCCFGGCGGSGPGSGLGQASAPGSGHPCKGLVVPSCAAFAYSTRWLLNSSGCFSVSATPK